MGGEQEQVPLAELPKSAKKAERRAHPHQAVSTPAELKVEEGTADEDVDERRSYQRLDVAYSVEAAFTLGGHEVMRLALSGTTIDISRGGMLIRVEQDVTPGARCEVHFPDAKGQIVPDKVSGKVRRSRGHEKAFDIAIEFDVPLEVLQM